jgi:hypothetical protein
MKCPNKECSWDDWKITNPHGYTFIFTCGNCGEEVKIISLVDLELRCKEE